MINLNDARRVIRAAEKRAQDLGCSVSIAVVDASGHVIAQVRMDGAYIAGIDAAANKAYAARSFDTATSNLREFARQANDLYGIASLGRRAVLSAGGVPLRINGQVSGAIGVSGASANEDEIIARAGASAAANRVLNGHLNGYYHEEDSYRNSFSQIERLGQRSVLNEAQYCSLQ